jgi:acetolactate synthase I/II/III large subunit
MQRGLSRSAEVVRATRVIEHRRTADVLVDILVDSGVEVVFGIPGGSVAPIQDALLDRKEVRSITTRTEAGAVFAAAGYARAASRLAVVLVTSGPGITNTLTGLASAASDGLPVLVIAGEVARKSYGRGALQESSHHGLDVVHAAKPLCKLAFEVHDANSAPAMLRRAIATALSGTPGPVLITIPLDISTMPIAPPIVDVHPRIVFEPEPSTLTKVASALAGAKRGLLFVGSGARAGDGPRAVRELAERLQIPVMTTPKAKGVFPESHPLSLGVFGWGGHLSASEYLTGGVDVLMAIGTGLGEAATNNWSELLKGSEHFIQLDAEARKIGRSYPVTIGVAGFVGDVLPLVQRQLDALGTRPRATKKFGVIRKDTGDMLLEGTEGRIAPQRALWELQQVLPRNTLYSADMGDHTFFALHHLEIDQPDGFVSMLGLASMQSGIGAAVGMKVARPTRTVVAVCGDGCFAMGIGDVATAAHEQLPIIVAVMNDQRLGMVEGGHTAIYGRSPDFSTGPLDIPTVAKGIGADSAVIERPGQILELGLDAISRRVPIVLDIRIDRSIRQSRGSRVEFIKKTALRSNVN